MAQVSSYRVVRDQNSEHVNVGFHFDEDKEGLKSDVAKILNVEVTSDWSVIDTKKNEDIDLRMVHYLESENAEDIKNPTLRGVLVDVKNQCVLAPSLGYEHLVIADSISLQDNEVTVVDVSGKIHSFTRAVRARSLMDCVILRAIWYNGEFYLMSYKKIDPSRSRWGFGKGFIDMYNEGNGPKPEDLFDTSKKYSSTCFTFAVRYPTLANSNRTKKYEPSVVLIDRVELNLPFEDVAPGISDKTPQDDLCVEEVNHFLQHGFYEARKYADYRLAPGEAVLMFERDENGRVLDMVKVMSHSYDWRNNLRSENPNVYNQLYKLLDRAFTDKEIQKEENWEFFKSSFLIFEKISFEDLKKKVMTEGGIIDLPVESNPDSRTDLYSRENRLFLVYVNFLFSLPPSIQCKHLDMYTKYKEDRRNLANFTIDGKGKTGNKMIDDLYRNAFNVAKKNKGDLTANFKRTVDSFLKTTKGENLYKMVMYRERTINPRT